MDSRDRSRKRSLHSTVSSDSRRSYTSSSISHRSLSRGRRHRSTSYSSARSSDYSKSRSPVRRRRYSPPLRRPVQARYGAYGRYKKPYLAQRSDGGGRSRYSPKPRAASRSRSPMNRRYSRSRSGSMRRSSRVRRNKTSSLSWERSTRRPNRARRPASRSASFSRDARSPYHSPSHRALSRRRRHSISNSSSSSFSPRRGRDASREQVGRNPPSVIPKTRRRDSVLEDGYPQSPPHYTRRPSPRATIQTLTPAAPDTFPRDSRRSAAYSPQRYRQSPPRRYPAPQNVYAVRNSRTPGTAASAAEFSNGRRYPLRDLHDYRPGRPYEPYRGAAPMPRRPAKPGIMPRRGGVPPVVDRSSTCPFLLRVYYNLNKHHAEEDLANFLRFSSYDPLQSDEQGETKSSTLLENKALDEKEPPLPPAKLDALHGSELQLYTWKDTSLREIVDLVKDVCPEARIRSSRLSLKLLHLGDEGTYTACELGTLHNSRPGSDDRRTLLRSVFEIGDAISIAILPMGNPRAPQRRAQDVNGLSNTEAHHDTEPFPAAEAAPAGSSAVQPTDTIDESADLIASPSPFNDAAALAEYSESAQEPLPDRCETMDDASLTVSLEENTETRQSLVDVL